MSDTTTPGDYALYRYFDSADRLLYVGISGELAARDKAHIAHSRWMRLAARSAIERHPTLEAVGAAEEQVIKAEHPLFNVQFNDTPEARARLRAYLEEIGRLDLLSKPAEKAGKRAYSSPEPRPIFREPPPSTSIAEEFGFPWMSRPRNIGRCLEIGEQCRRPAPGCLGVDGISYPCVLDGHVPNMKPPVRSLRST